MITYNSALSACEKASEWQRALALLQEMRIFKLQVWLGCILVTVNEASGGGIVLAGPSNDKDLAGAG